MKTLKATALAALISTIALPTTAISSEDPFFRELDANGDGAIDRTEFDIQKGAVLYAIDKNHNLKVERSETRLTLQQFRQYAGDDGIIDGLEVFDVPSTRFEAFDQNGDQKITPEESRQQLAVIRGEAQTAEGR